MLSPTLSATSTLCRKLHSCNPRPIKDLRTLCKKHPGYRGSGSPLLPYSTLPYFRYVPPAVLGRSAFRVSLFEFRFPLATRHPPLFPCAQSNRCNLNQSIHLQPICCTPPGWGIPLLYLLTPLSTLFVPLHPSQDKTIRPPSSSIVLGGLIP